MRFDEELLAQGMEIPYACDTNYYKKPLTLYGKVIPNRIGILPLEGFDSKADGSPSAYTYRRYLRFVEGGAGLIWFEACAVSEDAKSNPAQMMLNAENVDSFRNLITEMDQRADEIGREHCYKVLQLTHSGRMSKNEKWEGIPLSPVKRDDNDTAQLATDEKIKEIIDSHILAAVLAKEAGFDAVDIKVCHGYFLSELLGAYNRAGAYGGSFENRTAAVFEIIDGIRSRLGDELGISVRLNAYDSVPYPYGYGIVMEDGRKKANLSEAVLLCKLLKEKGVRLINISASAPAERLFGPEPIDAKYKKYGVSCDYLTATKIIKENVDDVYFMCTGLSSFEVQGGNIGAGGIRDGWFDIAGFGRQALAYPQFADDLLNNGKMSEEKICINCNSCFRLMDPGHCRTGCIVRDRDEFFELYNDRVLKKEKD